MAKNVKGKFPNNDTVSKADCADNKMDAGADKNNNKSTQTRRKPNRFNKSNKSRNDDKEIRSKFNDWRWYAANEQLLRDAASISFNTASGSNIGPWSTEYKQQNGGTAPGIMAMRFRATYGISKDTYSSVNVAARKIYSFVRHANSGHSNYDAPDLMLYLMAMDNVYMLFNYLKRLYGMMFFYDIKNRYTPKILVESMGCDYESVVNDMANFRYRLNMAAAKINSLCVPSVMPIFLRHSWLVSNIFMDGMTSKSQYYGFLMDGIYKFNETGDPKGGYLEYVALGSSGNVIPYTTYMDTLEKALAAIISSEDMNIMSGDILKAYGDSQLFQVSSVPEDYVVMAVYNPEVMWQIHNATICLMSGSTNQNITQDPDTNAIIYNPVFRRINGGLGSRYLDINKPVVEPADIMVATRLTNVPISITDNPSYDSTSHTVTVNISHIGSEVITDCVIYTKTRSNATTWLDSKIRVYDGVVIGDDTTSIGSLNTVATMAKFDMCPMVPVYDELGQTKDMSNITLMNYTGEIDNWTIIDNTELDRMHDTALLSLFGIDK